ncbi:orotidine-5'-phosphate decarboxylase [Legionella maioricensis]|uniref:Orotidine 5'-phosphate decarboxylase n=1 Tax=Legionella maioricensis TaxID=2896528 RepID=A0A9X2IAR8_9GAMM|nr:orotidine-5'-phosphate decarboxylase [Legionella maioricensis]MCL9684244.1 orotidine-5'-phosphate decarboxylase [Legionella maioricensis]MCL9687110.1 orotidine-5'-phosphate decarboxylase [Legionella maioricensis]
MVSKLIVALDFDNQDDALNLVDKLDPTSCALKVGSEMFTLFGANFIKLLVSRQFKIFLDLKFHDIPNTVAQACKACADLGVWMINVHALGGFKMMQTAREAIEVYGKDRPLLIAVTVLTSFSEKELSKIGINYAIIDQVKLLASLSRDAGLDGVVSSAHEVQTIKQKCGNKFLTVTPGIRLSNNSRDDQTRVMTPLQAINEGSDYLVVGRPITQASNPAMVVSEILKDIGLD